MGEHGRSAYQPEFDLDIYSELVPGDHNWDIEAKVSSYKGGVPKLQLTRRHPQNGYHRKLGRMTSIEIERVRDLLTRLLEMQLEDKDEPTETEPVPQCSAEGDYTGPDDEAEVSF